MTDITFNANLREKAGKGAARACRREGRVPAVVYGNKQEAVNISLHPVELEIQDHYKTYRKTTRTELDKMLRRICENYYQITGMTNVVNKLLRPYNPMELK